MIVKVLGALDIFVGLCFWLFGIFHLVPGSFIMILGLFLLAKGIAFATGLSFASFLDIGSSLIIITATSLEIPRFLVIIVSLFLLQKGAFSMMG